MLMQRSSSFESTHSTAQEEAYQHIRHAIRMGLQRPGARLVPEEIASALGMSRMPVREALNWLAAEGLIVMRPNRGPWCATSPRRKCARCSRCAPCSKAWPQPWRRGA